MIPRLYESSETSFTTFGICPLPETLSCSVTEEKNGQYTLELTYPRSGMWFSEIKVDRIILATAHEGDEHAQPFRIERIEGSIEEIVTIYAVHISYQLNWIIVGQFTSNISTSAPHVRSPLTYWNQYVSHMLSASNPFTMESSMSEECPSTYTISVDEATPLRTLLGGMEGSMLDHWHGEFEWDRYVVKYNEHRGVDNGVRILYGKNLTGIDWETDVSETYTSVVAYYKAEDVDGSEIYVQGSIQTVNVPTSNTFAFERTIIVDTSADFDGAPTVSQLNTYAQNYVKANAKAPIVSFTIQFVPLWQSEEYKDYADFEKVGLCDTVHIVYPPLGIELEAQVVKTVYNVLLDRYDSIEVSTSKKNLATTIFAMEKEIKRNSITGGYRRLTR